MTAIPDHLLAAYRAAEYRVEAGSTTLRFGIDRGDQALSHLLQCHRASGAALVTACNPRGQVLDEEANARRHATLVDRLDRDDRVWLPAHGDDPGGDYPGEASVLILGIDRSDALKLGRELDQNAIVWVDADAVPRLVLLR